MADVTINEQDTLAGPDYVSVTDASKTLATLLGTALQTNVKRITLVPDSSGIFWIAGTAVAATSAPLPSSGVELSVRKTYADTLQFITASGTVKMQIIQEG